MRTKNITVPGNLAIACEQFNSGEFFECHETLEEVWQEEVGDVRDLYKGLIQVAAAFVHVRRDNFNGARRLLTTGLGYLAPYRAEGAMGFDVEAFCGGAESALAELLDRGPGRAWELYPGFAPVLRLHPGDVSAEAVRWRAWGFDRDGTPLEMEIPAGD